MTIRSGENLKALLDRVRRAASPRGKKKALADYLGVGPTSVSNWLAEDKAPNGEITLLMLQWVEVEEAQKMSAPGSATNTAKGRTRLTQSLHEKRKTGPPKQ